MKTFVRILLLIEMFFISWDGLAQIAVVESGGWLESLFVKWTPLPGADGYHLYCSGNDLLNQKIDDPLIRCYNTYFRADVAGLSAGTYTVKVVPVVSGSEQLNQATEIQGIKVMPHQREGFAFLGPITKGKPSVGFVPGAYNMDGTPKKGAQIIYVTAKSVNTVACNIINEKKVSVAVSGLMNILAAKGKGYDKTPLIIRMIGTVKQAEVTGLTGSGGIYFGFIGANTTDRLMENVTFEGIGDDATAYGIGFFTKRCRGIEIRNVGIMLFGDDGVSMEADNTNIWVHHCDFFYGSPGSDADQKKGDGSIDMKYNTTNITLSYNHFFDSGKSTFAGGATESNPIYFTYHHNWFDHSDSRHPRTCWATVHLYNNYMDGNQTMCLLNTEASSVFVEANSFRNCPYPMMINMQGTNYEKWPTGTQNGGMTKAFNNKIDKVTKLLYQTDRASDFDAYLVSTREELIPATVVSRKGGNTYSNFDTDSLMYAYTPDSPDSVPQVVTKYAGRMGGGDLKWSFNNAVDDALTDVNLPLKAVLLAYQSKLAYVQGEQATGLDVLSAGSVSIVLNAGCDELQIRSDSPIRTIDLLDLYGRRVMHLGANTERFRIDQLPNGLYFVEIRTEKGNNVQKMVKR